MSKSDDCVWNSLPRADAVEIAVILNVLCWDVESLTDFTTSKSRRTEKMRSKTRSRPAVSCEFSINRAKWILQTGSMFLSLEGADSKYRDNPTKNMLDFISAGNWIIQTAERGWAPFPQRIRMAKVKTPFPQETVMM